MKKRASEYNVGELLMEFDGRPAGTVISKMDDPYRVTRAYILVRSADGSWTIYSCLKDAMCDLCLVRNVPEQVMRQFLWDAFVGMELEPISAKPAVRVPILDPLPSYGNPESQPALVINTQPQTGPQSSAPEDGQSSFPQAAETKGKPPEEASPDRMLPEFDFLF
jgi:hypothetical protein